MKSKIRQGRHKLSDSEHHRVNLCTSEAKSYCEGVISFLEVRATFLILPHRSVEFTPPIHRLLFLGEVDFPPINPYPHFEKKSIDGNLPSRRAAHTPYIGSQKKRMTYL